MHRHPLASQDIRHQRTYIPIPTFKHIPKVVTRKGTGHSRHAHQPNTYTYTTQHTCTIFNQWFFSPPLLYLVGVSVSVPTHNLECPSVHTVLFVVKQDKAPLTWEQKTNHSLAESCFNKYNCVGYLNSFWGQIREFFQLFEDIIWILHLSSRRFKKN